MPTGRGFAGLVFLPPKNHPDLPALPNIINLGKYAMHLNAVMCFSKQSAFIESDVCKFKYRYLAADSAFLHNNSFKNPHNLPLTIIRVLPESRQVSFPIFSDIFWNEERISQLPALTNRQQKNRMFYMGCGFHDGIHSFSYFRKKFMFTAACRIFSRIAHSQTAPLKKQR